MNKKLFLIATLMGLSIVIMSCEPEGPPEQSGVNIEEAIEKAHNKLETDPQGSAEQSEEKIDESIDQIGERLEKLGGKIQEKAQQ